MLMLSFHFF